MRAARTSGRRSFPAVSPAFVCSAALRCRRCLTGRPHVHDVIPPLGALRRQRIRTPHPLLPRSTQRHPPVHAVVCRHTPHTCMLPPTPPARRRARCAPCVCAPGARAPRGIILAVTPLSHAPHAGSLPAARGPHACRLCTLSPCLPSHRSIRHKARPLASSSSPFGLLHAPQHTRRRSWQAPAMRLKPRPTLPASAAACSSTGALGTPIFEYITCQCAARAHHTRTPRAHGLLPALLQTARRLQAWCFAAPAGACFSPSALLLLFQWPPAPPCQSPPARHPPHVFPCPRRRPAPAGATRARERARARPTRT